VGKLSTITGSINCVSTGRPQITIDLILKFYLYLTMRDEASYYDILP